MIKEILATLLITFSGASNTFKAPPKKEMLTKVGGTYNLRNAPNYDYLENYSFPTSEIIYFGQITDENKPYAPVRYNNKTYELTEINIDFDGTQNTKNLFVTVKAWPNNLTIEYDITYGDTIEAISQVDGSMYFYMIDSLLLNEKQNNLFKAVFTAEENYYTKNYSGYYSFNNTVTTLPYDVNMYGSIMLGNEMVYSVTSKNDYTPNYFETIYFDTESNYYYTNNFNVPITASGVSNQWYINGAKMTETEYTNWQRYGTFGYVPQTPPDAYSFNDLFFSLADTPIYFIYSIFNWQLFGANLFIAFIGLISFALVLLLFRRFL